MFPDPEWVGSGFRGFVPVFVAIVVVLAPIQPDASVRLAPETSEMAVAAATRVVVHRMTKASDHIPRDFGLSQWNVTTELENLTSTLQELQSQLRRLETDKMINALTETNFDVESKENLEVVRMELESKTKALQHASGNQLSMVRIKKMMRARLDIALHWTRLPLHRAHVVSSVDKYVFRKFPEEYSKLLSDGFLTGPAWEVRFVRLNAQDSKKITAENCDNDDEEWLVRFEGSTSRADIFHQLSDCHRGLNLTRDQARDFLTEYLVHLHPIAPTSDIDSGTTLCTSFKEIGAQPVQRPSRIDWNFRFKCKNNNFGVQSDRGSRYEEDALELRIDGLVSGRLDGTLEVLGIQKSVQPSEIWLRNERKLGELIFIFQMLAWFVAVIFLVVGSGYSLYVLCCQRNSKILYSNVCIGTLGYVFLNLIRTLNALNKLAFKLSSTEPLGSMLYRKVTVGLVKCVSFGGILGLCYASTYAISQTSYKNRKRRPSSGVRIAAAGFGIVMQCLEWACASQFGFSQPRLMPTRSLESFSCILEIVSSELLDYWTITTFSVMAAGLLLAIDGIQPPSLVVRFRTLVCGIVCGILGFLFAGLCSAIPFWSVHHYLELTLLASLLIYLGHTWIFRFHATLVPLAVAGFQISNLITQTMLTYASATSTGMDAFKDYPYSSIGAGYVCTFISIWMTSISWSKSLTAF